jgi:hypothetical protein
MRVLSISLNTATLVVAVFLLSCNRQNETNEPKDTVIASKPVTGGSRIAWDYSSLRAVSDLSSPNSYNGYARIKQLKDKTLIVIYESGGNIMVRKSADYGNSWGNTVMVAAKTDGINMAVPDLLELQDGSLLAMYNPRPFNIDPSRKFGIRIKKSYDKGATWKDEQLLYEAGYQFQNGCWEPAAIQLPSGEIQLFFANEGPYTNSDEQNISMLRSSDNGTTWTKIPTIASFRPGKRDGMPVPILLQDNTTIVFAIEDNGINTFKPYTIRNTIAENWTTTVDAASEKRVYALSGKLPDEIYAGAPYLVQLKTGETILSYQGTEGRTNNIDQAEMKVALGDAQAKAFSKKTVPFKLASNKSGLWSSLTVLDDNSVIAVTSTSNYSSQNHTDSWMIRGYIIPEIPVAKNTIDIDANTNEPVWGSTPPIFVGHTTESQVKANITYDDSNLYILLKVKDNTIVKGSSSENSDGITVFLDPQNKTFEKPHTGIFSFSVTADGKLLAKEGKNGNWQVLQYTEEIKFVSKQIAGGYLQELSIPWALLAVKPPISSRIGLNLRLTELNAPGGVVINEDASGCNASEPFSWLSLFLK